MAGNIGRNYSVQFYEKITFFLVSRIKYCVLTMYTLSRPYAELLFCVGNSRLLLLFPFGLKDDDCSGTLVSHRKYFNST